MDLPYGEALMSRNVHCPMLQSFTEEDTGDIVHALGKVAAHYRK